MIDFMETYESRKKEIDDFLAIMEFLENKEKEKIDEDGKSSFDKFFRSEENSINLSYQSMINIMKSNVSLMIYNIIEFTVSGLIDIIYDKIQRESLTYIDVSECIQKIWRKTLLKQANDPNANFNTFIKRNETIINHILQNKIIELKTRDSLAGGGNFDGDNIIQAFSSHGISIDTNSINYRPDILDIITKKRNNLAHGSVSFVEAMRDDAIVDIDKNKKIIILFLSELISKTKDYIDNFRYKQIS